MITFDTLKQIAPTANKDLLNDIAEYADDVMEQYNINTPLRKAHFLAQAAHESGGFRAIVENLNYSAKGLLTTFKKYFNASTAAQYERKPEMIANKVYANRMGNGPESSGDGFKYRGRGIFQITGKSNYDVIGQEMGVDLVTDPDILLEAINALYSACIYWDKRGLNNLADDDDVEGITRKINGGLNGLEERIMYLNRAKKALGA